MDLDRDRLVTPLTMVQWCVHNHPHSSRLRSILLEMMEIAQGEHVERGECWSNRAMLRWSVDGRDHPTHSENGGEGVKETLDAAVRLWRSGQN